MEVNSSKEELRTKWVEALRSGEYKQTLGTLCDEKGFCCLGVAGKIIGLTNEEMSTKLPTKEFYESAYFKIKNAFGLTDTLGQFEDGALYLLNDFDEYDFNKIADIIESKPEGLFENV